MMETLTMNILARSKTCTLQEEAILQSALRLVNSTDEWMSLEEHNEKLGFLGSGSYSAAYTHEALEDRVIKIGAGHDSAEFFWAMCASSNVDYLPETSIVIRLGRYVGCVCEHLDPLPSAVIEFMDEVGSYSPFIPANIEEVKCQFQQDFPNINSDDLHSGNIMMRSDGTLIINDPGTDSSGATSYYKAAA